MSGMKRKMGSLCGDCDVVSEAETSCKDDPHINPLYCLVCDVLCNSTAMMENHVNGKKHKKKMLGQGRTINAWEFWCDSCLIGCNSDATMKMHLDGKMHKANQEKSCKRRRLLQVEIKKEGPPNCMEVVQIEEVKVRSLIEKEEENKKAGANCKESVNMEACCNEKEEEIKHACIKGEELIKLVEIKEETRNCNEEELKKNFCDEKMQDEANYNAITEHEEEVIMARTVENGKEEEIKKDDVCDDEKTQGDANQIIGDEKTETIDAIKQEEYCNTTEMGAKVGMGRSNMAMSTNTGGKDGLWCDICKLQCNSYPMMLAHRSGKKHTAIEAKACLKANKDRVDLQQDTKMCEMKEERNKEFWCLICRVKCDTQAMITKHLKGPEHKAKLASRRR